MANALSAAKTSLPANVATPEPPGVFDRLSTRSDRDGIEWSLAPGAARATSRVPTHSPLNSSTTAVSFFNCRFVPVLFNNEERAENRVEKLNAVIVSVIIAAFPAAR